jgi:uncharacterized protein (DUF1697 family)
MNVGGRAALSMAALREALAAAGLRDVETILQSGNVLVGAGGDDDALAAIVEAVIAASFGLSVRALVRTGDDLRRALAAAPFPDADPATLHLTFLAAPSDRPVADAPPDAVRVIGREAHVWCPGGYGRTKLTTTWLERCLGVAATTRNLATVTKLADRLRDA